MVVIRDQHRHKHEVMLFSGAPSLSFISPFPLHFSLGQAVPDGYRIVAIQGFLEELVVNDDPEYQVCIM